MRPADVFAAVPDLATAAGTIDKAPISDGSPALIMFTFWDDSQ